MRITCETVRATPQCRVVTSRLVPLVLVAASCGTARSVSKESPDWSGGASIQSEVLGASRSRSARQEELAQLNLEKASMRAELASEESAQSAPPASAPAERAQEPSPVTTPEIRPKPGEMLVVTGTLELAVEDVAGAAAAIRGITAAAGGAITTDSISSAAGGTARGRVVARIPPAKLGSFLDQLGRIGRIDSRRIDAADVSREYFDQELAIKNLQVTITRLQALLERQSGNLGEVMQIERELTRVRGEIEQLKGSQRYLRDRVSLATLQIDLAGRALVPASQAEVKFRLLPTFSVLRLHAPLVSPRERVGGGATLSFARVFSVELLLHAAPAGGSTSWMLTATSAVYSDLLGGGQRRYLNPYLGLRAGGGNFDDKRAWAAGAEAGVELYRGRYLTLEVAARALVLYFPKTRTTSALQGVFAVGVPF
jgi:hypothetical protein